MNDSQNFGLKFLEIRRKRANSEKRLKLAASTMLGTGRLFSSAFHRATAAALEMTALFRLAEKSTGPEGILHDFDQLFLGFILVFS